MRTLVQILLLTLLASCTALTQKDSYIDALPRAAAPVAPVNNVVFADDFENGLGQWSPTSGSWAVSNSGGISGNYLQSPSSTSAISFNISTLNNLNLVGRTNCILEYDARFLIKGVSGASATVLFDTTIVGNFKDTSGLTDITSSSAFVHRKALLPNNGYGRLSFYTTVINDTTGYADLRIDNVAVTCASSASTSVTVAYDDLNSAASNWTLQGPWAWSGSVGYLSSGAIQFITTFTGSGNSLATYAGPLDLTNRYSCKLSFYYSEVSSAGNCFYAEWNGIQIWSLCSASSASGIFSTYLTPFEGISSNTFAYRCQDVSTVNTINIACTVDEVKLTCQQ